MTHRLQDAFASAEGEAQYVDGLRDRIEAGQLDAAETLLHADLAALDTPLARTCLALPREAVILQGWPELVEAIAAYEGDAIACVAVGMGNDTDLSFEKDQLHAPFVTVGLYSDQCFPFSSASRQAMLLECGKQQPAWAGAEEDIEIYLEIDGLAELNTRLILHKQRFFLRDDTSGAAPALYVDYVLSSWLRALRFHQAVRAAIDAEGLPGNIPVISGIFGMTPDPATVHVPEKTVKATIAEVAPLVFKPKAKRSDAIIDLSGSDLRRRIGEAPAEPAAPSRGFLSRLFRRAS
jgi:hypothetical protein